MTYHVGNAEYADEPTKLAETERTDAVIETDVIETTVVAATLSQPFESCDSSAVVHQVADEEANSHLFSSNVDRRGDASIVNALRSTNSSMDLESAYCANGAVVTSILKDVGAAMVKHGYDMFNLFIFDLHLVQSVLRALHVLNASRQLRGAAVETDESEDMQVKASEADADSIGVRNTKSSSQFAGASQGIILLGLTI